MNKNDLPEERTRPHLHHAAATQKNDLIRSLIEKGADPNERDCDGLTPLHWSVMMGGLESIAMLVAAGADPNAVDENGATPLHFSVVGASREIVVVLFDARSDINARDDEGNTSLHRAAAQSHEAIRILLDIGADPTLKNGVGKLPEECVGRQQDVIGYDPKAMERLVSAREAWELAAVAGGGTHDGTGRRRI